MGSQPQQASIGNLLMTNDSAGERPGSLHKTNLVAPKPMGRTFSIGFSPAEGVSRAHRVRRKCGIRHNLQQRGLSRRTACPACFCLLLKPVLNLVVAFTRGESSGRSKIVTPFTTRVGLGTVKPRRTRSDTALPSASDLCAAYRFTTGTMSSSSEIVVRMAE